MTSSFWLAQDIPSFSAESPASWKCPRFWGGWSPYCWKQSANDNFRKVSGVCSWVMVTVAEQTGLILWGHSAKCLCSDTFPGLCFCPVVQDVNHYQVLIPLGRKTKSESSKGVNEKLHIYPASIPSCVLELTFVTKLAPREAGKWL